MRSASALHDWYRTLVSVDALNAGPAVLRKSAAYTVAFDSRPVTTAVLSSGQGPDRPYGRPRRRFRSRSPTWLPSNRFLRVSLRSASPRCGAALIVEQRIVDDKGSGGFGRADSDLGVPYRPVDFVRPDLIEDGEGPGAAAAAFVDARPRICGNQSPSRPSRPSRMTSAAACGSRRRASTSARSASN